LSFMSLGERRLSALVKFRSGISLKILAHK
jgi:hypothetical protein